MNQFTPPTVLVVEDEQELRELLAESLEAQGFAVAQAGDAADAIQRLEGFAYDALVVDLRLPDADGMDRARIGARRGTRRSAAVVMTGFGGVDEAVKAIRRGAIEFLIKPFPLGHLAQILQTGITERKLQLENAQLRAQLHGRFSFDAVIGRSAAMQHVFSTLELVAPMNSSVLIQGETGTGKELIARTIHHNSPRRDQPFVAFNAAAIPESLAEAELFGHVKGAFTGAVNSRVGRFELAHRGTLFIDEVGDDVARAAGQAAAGPSGTGSGTRGRIARRSSSTSACIAASNVDLRKLVKDGAFREDLFYRLNVVPITLPPLRNRREDIALIAQHFLQKSCKSNGLTPRVLSQATLRLLMDFAWPGNIRQLENAIEHAVAMSGADREIVPAMLPEDVRIPGQSAMLTPVTIPDEGLDFTSVMTQLERELLRRGLEKTGGNKRQAARLLNLSRTTLIDKLNRLGGDGVVTSAA